MPDIEDILDREDEVGGWRQEVKRLRRALQETEAAQEQTRKLNVQLVDENKALRLRLTKLAALALEGLP
jgi:regulator of replication initiation timing